VPQAPLGFAELADEPPEPSETRRPWPLMLLAGAVSFPYHAILAARRGLERAASSLGRMGDEWKQRGEAIWRAWWGKGPRAHRGA
jgi:hypothetical protein